MVELELGNIWTHIKSKEELDHELLKEINEDLSYIIQEYSPFRKESVNYKYSLLHNGNEVKYPTGLYSYVSNVFDKHNVKFDVVDEREYPKQTKELKVHGKEYRDYQQKIIDDAIIAQRGIIKVATGGGKTVIGASIIARLNLNTIFVVHTIDLLEQAYDEISDMLQLEIGRLGGGHCEIKKFTVATIQTINAALGYEYEPIDDESYIKEEISEKILNKKDEVRRMVENADVVINDECQHSKAVSFVNFLTLAENAFYKYGLSATPFKYDSTDIILEAYTGKIIANITASYLIERGFLVRPIIYILPPNKITKYQFFRKKFRTIYKEYIVENDERNGLIIDCVHRFLEMDKTVLITVSLIKHGKIILKMLEEEIPDIKAAFIRGEVKKKDRKILLQKIRERELNVLIGTTVADEGLDLPALDAAILAGGGKSLIKCFQRIGRTLRPYPNVENNIKEEAIIVDFYDRIRYLTGQSKRRIEIYNMEKEFEVREHF